MKVKRVPMTDDVRASMCIGKVAFPSPAVAYAATKKRRPGERMKPREPYRCPFCGMWHLGAKKK